MLGFRQRVGVPIAAGLAMMGISRGASAKTVVTPFGEADDSCVHETPMGGAIDVQTGDVRLGDKVVDHFPPCAVSWQLQVPYASRYKLPSPTLQGTWVTWTNAEWPLISGQNYPFDGFYAYWTVPTNPQPPSGDNPVEFFFNSLTNTQYNNSEGVGCPSGSMLIQPVLQWGASSAGGGQYWSIASYEVYGCSGSPACQTGCTIGHSPIVNVAQGDVIWGSMWQTASSPDTWEIYTEYTNSSTSGYTYNTIYNIPNTWDKFGSAQGGVLENYITACDDLSTDNSITFYEDGAYVADPSWSSSYEVDYYGANLLTWSGYNANYPSPSCSYNYSIPNDYSSTLTWKE
jgi:hypothetical protein